MPRHLSIEYKMMITHSNSSPKIWEHVTERRREITTYSHNVLFFQIHSLVSCPGVEEPSPSHWHSTGAVTSPMLKMLLYSAFSLADW
ncbi:hypothetical protein TNCV_516871 [Trichonephila clavipes]|nr:hypothetical protein TNCV_516871 [Trichonephila clavipes]